MTGNPYGISQHSYGNAIDINTVENPYVTGSRVYPSFARGYLDRSSYRKGMILRGGVIASKMAALGWPWGHAGRTRTTSTSRRTAAERRSTVRTGPPPISQLT